MKNIIEICKGVGVDVPEDKHAELLKAVSDEGYITVAEHDKKLKRAENDRDTYKKRAEDAEATLKSFEGIDPAQIQTELATYKKRAEDAEKDAQAKIAERDFADALKTETDGIQFTSEAAKRDVLAQIKAAGLTLKDGKILGLSDLVEQIRKSDASAFVDTETQALEAGKPRFTDKLSGTPQPSQAGGVTKQQIMSIKDRGERRAAIAANMGLFNKPGESQN